MFNAYLISTLKFQFEKNYKFNYITSAMFNAYKISTLKLEKIKYFDKLKNSEKIEKNKKLKKSLSLSNIWNWNYKKMQRPPTWKTAEIELWLSAVGITCV